MYPRATKLWDQRARTPLRRRRRRMLVWSRKPPSAGKNLLRTAPRILAGTVCTASKSALIVLFAERSVFSARGTEALDANPLSANFVVSIAGLLPEACLLADIFVADKTCRAIVSTEEETVARLTQDRLLRALLFQTGQAISAVGTPAAIAAFGNRPRADTVVLRRTNRD